MISFRKRTVMVPLSVAALLALGLPQASAQGLFDVLFGGLPRNGQKLKGEFPPPPQVKKKAPAPITRISSPTYNKYKADSLVPVDFKALASASQTAPEPADSPAAQNAAFQPTEKPAENDAFHQALGGLADYDLLAERDIAKALTAYYSAHPSFLWVSDAAVSANASEALKVLGEAGSYGLNPLDYTVDVPPAEAAGVDAAERQKQLIRSKWRFRHACCAMSAMRRTGGSIPTASRPITIFRPSRSTCKGF